MRLCLAARLFLMDVTRVRFATAKAHGLVGTFAMLDGAHATTSSNTRVKLLWHAQAMSCVTNEPRNLLYHGVYLHLLAQPHGCNNRSGRLCQYVLDTCTRGAFRTPDTSCRHLHHGMCGHDGKIVHL